MNCVVINRMDENKHSRRGAKKATMIRYYTSSVAKLNRCGSLVTSFGGADAGSAGVAAPGRPVGGVAAVEVEILHTKGDEFNYRFDLGCCLICQSSLINGLSQ